MEKFPADAVGMIKQHYDSLPARLSAVKGRLGRSMTLAEKILFAHWQDDGGSLPERGVSPFLSGRTSQISYFLHVCHGYDVVPVRPTSR